MKRVFRLLPHNFQENCEKLCPNCRLWTDRRATESEAGNTIKVYIVYAYIERERRYTFLLRKRIAFPILNNTNSSSPLQSLSRGFYMKILHAFYSLKISAKYVSTLNPHNSVTHKLVREV